MSYESVFFDDYDASALAFYETHYISESRYFSQELRLTSEAESAFQWIIGGYFMDSTAEQSNNADYTDMVYFGFPSGGVGYGAYGSYVLDATSYAAFAQTTYLWTDKLLTTHAVRYSHDEVNVIRSGSSFSMFPRTSPMSYTNSALHTDITGVPLVGKTGEETFNELTWRLAAEYKAREDILLYASISRGYKSGGFNLGAYDPDQFGSVDPESLIAYEGGIKSRWFDNRSSSM